MLLMNIGRNQQIKIKEMDIRQERWSKETQKENFQKDKITTRIQI